MHPTRLTNESLRSRCRLYYREEPYYSPPALPSEVKAHLRRRYPRGATRSAVEYLYQASLERLLGDDKGEKDDEEEESRTFPGALTKLHLLLDYSRRTKFVTCVLAFPRFPGESFYAVVQRSFILFAIYQGVDGPDIPFELVHPEASKEDHFRLLEDDNLGNFYEVLIEPHCPEVCGLNDFLREWIEGSTQRAMLHSFLCSSPNSKAKVHQALKVMSVDM